MMAYKLLSVAAWSILNLDNQTGLMTLLRTKPQMLTFSEYHQYKHNCNNPYEIIIYSLGHTVNFCA